MRWIFGIAVLSFLLYAGGNYLPGFFQFFPHGFTGQNPYEPVPLPGMMGTAEAGELARGRFVVDCERHGMMDSELVTVCTVFDKKTRTEYTVVRGWNGGVAVLDSLSEGR